MFEKTEFKPLNELNENKYNLINLQAPLTTSVSQISCSHSFQILEFGTCVCTSLTMLTTTLTALLSNMEILRETEA